MNKMEHEFIEKKNENCKSCSSQPLPVVVILLLLGILVSLIYMITVLPNIVRSEVQREPALKAWGVANYERILNEVYNTPEYQKMMTEQLEAALVQNKQMMQMYSEQAASGDVSQEPALEETDVVPTTDELSGEIPAVVESGVAN